MINVFLSFGACTVGKTGKIEKIEKKSIVPSDMAAQVVNQV